MTTRFPMTTRELYLSIGLSSSDIAKVDNSAFIWVIAAFANQLAEPAAAFTNFGCALNLVKRLNAFVEGGVGLRPVLKSSNRLETDKYKRLTEIGLTPYLVQFNNIGNDVQLVDNLGDDLDELGIDKFMQDLNRISATTPINNFGNDFCGTFWAPNGHLAIKKAKVFMALLDSLLEKRQVDVI